MDLRLAEPRILPKQAYLPEKETDRSRGAQSHMDHLPRNVPDANSQNEDLIRLDEQYKKVARLEEELQDVTHRL